ncbi:ribokinase [Quadrisphaera sp. DSM 44207]|uniref:ribokinase n=1 Tax=Quadrisphaera sp. DSM 44207 TaxID=1881057 RepID=UPI000B896B08|nr:ribokinase [Quadrisphaera sp. DSM 44207]
MTEHPAPASAPDVVVLGSANADVVLAVERVPAAGETVLARSTARYPGGKGLNQAVAATRAGARTAFLAALGQDEAGSALAAVLTEHGVSAALVRRVDVPTGTAHIAVQDDGDNAIVVAPGANATLTGLTGRDAEAIATARVLVAQLEVPLEGVLAGARAAQGAGTAVVLNAAPARPLPDELLGLVDVLVVNEHEAAELAGASGAGGDVGATARHLLQRVPAVVVTLGGAGALHARRTAEEGRVPAPVVDVVDTTGAGDTCTGVLAAALAQGAPLADAVRRAVVAGALSVQVRGAVPSIPTAEQVDRALADHGGAARG